MEEVPVKRERESGEEDANERTAKVLLSSEPVRNLALEYLEMPRIQRSSLSWWKSFKSMPEPLQRIVATTNVGVLMTLARLDRMFADLARQDIVWKYCFERDFPREWKFCKGTLPFFVLEPNHPFYTPGSVSVEDASPWKRFYLRTAANYILNAQWFIKDFAYVIRNKDLPSINTKIDNAQSIYRWVQKMMLDLHFNEYDFRCALCWAWVVYFTAFMFPRKVWQTKESVAADYLLLSSQSLYGFYGTAEGDWMRKYLDYSHPYESETLWGGWGRSFGTDVYVKQSKIGPAPDDLEKYLENLDIWTDLTFEDDQVHIFDYWKDYQRSWNDKNELRRLFSTQDRKKVEIRLRVLRLSATFREELGISDDEYDQRVSNLMRLWDTLENYIQNPCVFSLTIFVAGLMITDAQIMKNGLVTLVDRIPEGQALDLDWLTISDTPFFPLPNLEHEFMHLVLPLHTFTNAHSSVHLPNQRAQLRSFILFYNKAPRTKEYAPGKTKIIYLQKCIQCGATPTLPQQCGGTCQRAIYCNVDCQMKHWISGHRNECQKKGLLIKK